MADNAWKPMTLGEFTTLQRGHDLPEERRRTGQIPILGSFGITGWHDEARAAGPGVTVGRSGASFGVVSYSSIPYWPLNTALYVKDFHGNDERFAYYLLKTFDFKRYNSGSAQPSLNRNYIHPIRIDVPPLSEQRAIAHILGTLDDKIELNRRMNETLEAMARAIFKSWFVDFDPVRAKMDGRKPAGMDNATAALFPDRFENSPFGKRPTGWLITTLGDICSEITDGSHLSPQSVENGRPMASVKDMTNWGINIKTCRQISPLDFEKLVAGGCHPSQGDILLAKDGAKCLETVCEYQQSDEIVLLSSVAILKSRLSAAASYLHIWLGLDSTKFYLKEGFVSGSAIPRVVLRDLKRAQLLFPAADILKVFDRTVRPLRDKIRENNESSRTLATIRDTLLPKLLSGEIRVAEAEQTVAEVA